MICFCCNRVSKIPNAVKACDYTMCILYFTNQIKYTALKWEISAALSNRKMTSKLFFCRALALRNSYRISPLCVIVVVVVVVIVKTPEPRCDYT